MSDRFHPLSTAQLVDWIFDELEQKDAIFGIPRSLFFRPDPADPFRREAYGVTLDTPFGVAAGPHSQMAQNIVVAWLCGARFIELKTVQTLDELEIVKPCIDMEDEGYNVEWSQELKVHESYEEYLRAWVLIHALHRRLGFPGEAPGLVFNVSVGYDYAGLQNENMQWYLRKVRDAGEDLERVRAEVRRRFPEVDGLAIPAALSDSITLSTMHGCPPDEIGKISAYLMREWEYHTSVKLNPTLLGPERLRGLLNEQLGFRDVHIPDEAFGHDLKREDALPLLRGLHEVADEKGLRFGVKLSNTLEVENHRTVFDAREKMMYLSGRPLQVITVALACRLQEAFDGGLYASYAGGADAFNVADLLRCGMQTVTSCSDLLKSGGYLRLLQYIEETRAAMEAIGATSLDDLVRRSAAAERWSEAGPTAPAAGELEALQLKNLGRHALAALTDPAARAGGHLRSRSKSARKLELFDCIEAPCMDSCAIDQQVPAYLRAVAEGRDADAVEITLADNAMATSLGRACDHKCELTCIRTHLDEPVAIRQIKRFIMEHEGAPARALPSRDVRVAIIGAGPCGLSAATFLGQAGYRVTLFEAHDYAGGMVSGTIPTYRTPDDAIRADLERVAALGVEIRYGQVAGRDFVLDQLLGVNFDYVIYGAGAQQGARLGIPGEEAEGVIEGLAFLRDTRHGTPAQLGEQVIVIGGGDVAMDCARTALRLASGEVHVVYRRTRDQMPGQKEEVDDFLDEGGFLDELLSPIEIELEKGRMIALKAEKMVLGERGADGRRRPVGTGETVRLMADSLILAIGQEPDLSFFGDAVIQRTRSGYLVVEPDTCRTNLERVYAGGDVVNDGPESIVAALEDGRRAAWDIRRREEPGFVPPPAYASPERERAALIGRRARREPRVKVPHLHPEQRKGFAEVVRGYDEAAARAEAVRCLDCDTFCSLCVSVCPNLAFLTYEAAPLSVELPVYRAAGAAAEEVGREAFALAQGPQVAVLTDFCNECGNCETFCPTSGAPYRVKPRLYLDAVDFAAQADNAFMLGRDPKGAPMILGRFGGEEHRLVLGPVLGYRAPGLEVKLDRDLSVLQVEVGEGAAPGERLSLWPAAVLFALGDALGSSARYLPRKV
ncbi:MAG: FAD-dependent oxidoreductase [Deltaproteobacteria bacterium]|nr:FAD-dependent oxidoreductase [Deltaproteobacteria bacterium]